MQYLLFDHMDACSEQEVARLLHVVSQQRREQALRYRHLFGQYCCLKAYEMLMELLDRPYTWNNLPEFQYNEYGQPRLADGPFFSISHCKAGVAVAVSEAPIGIDIETIRPIQPSLIAKTMNEAEQEMIHTADNPYLAFTQLWTKKEALLKMQGTGIIADLKDTLVDIPHVVFQTIANEQKGYVLSLAHSSID